MENTFVVNDEPITIRITIEVIPGNFPTWERKEEVAVKTPIVQSVPLTTIPPAGTINIQSYKPEEPEMVFEPMPGHEPAPEKKKRAYTRKVKTTEEPTVEEEKKDESVEEKKLIEVVPPKAETAKPAVPSNKVVARLAQMIRFYCKASGIETSTITIAHLKEKAFDIVENVSDYEITEAIKEAGGK